MLFDIIIFFNYSSYLLHLKPPQKNTQSAHFNGRNQISLHSLTFVNHTHGYKVLTATG